MRDTTVRQKRVPHTWDTLSMDCNIRLEDAQAVIIVPAPELSEALRFGLRMFAMFLQGYSYDEIATSQNLTRHAAMRHVQKAYSWFRLNHSVHV